MWKRVTYVGGERRGSGNPWERVGKVTHRALASYHQSNREFPVYNNPSCKYARHILRNVFADQCYNVEFPHAYNTLHECLIITDVTADLPHPS